MAEPNVKEMDDQSRLAACAVIENALKQIADPPRRQDHREELAVIMKGVDPVMVALEIATVLAGVAAGYKVPLGSMIEEIRARVVRDE
jgi:hypothetical protein